MCTGLYARSWTNLIVCSFMSCTGHAIKFFKEFSSQCIKFSVVCDTHVEFVHIFRSVPFRSQVYVNCSSVNTVLTRKRSCKVYVTVRTSVGRQLVTFREKSDEIGARYCYYINMLFLDL